MPSKPTSSARAYCSWYSLYSTCAFSGSKWVLGKPRRPDSYLLRSSSVIYPLGCSENQKTSTCSVGRRSCSTIRASCLLCMVTGISRSQSLSPEYVPSLGRCQSTTQHALAPVAVWVSCKPRDSTKARTHSRGCCQVRFSEELSCPLGH